MTFESTARKIARKYNGEKITPRGNPGAFEEVTDIERIKAIDPDAFTENHDRILADPEAFLGSGNNAIVYRMTNNDGEKKEPLCVKAVWGSSSHVSIKDGNTSKLPEVAKNLSKVQDYFNIIKNKKRKFIDQGFLFQEQVDAETEARYSNRANQLLKKAGSPVAIPWVSQIISIEREQSAYGDDVEWPYSWKEEVQLLIMDEVQGVTIEQMILGNEKHKKIREKINFDEFKEQLEDAMEIMHQHGLYHNDFSNRNIMINNEGMPVIIDFGGGENMPNEQPNEQLYEKNKNYLDKTMRWLQSYLNNPDDASKKLRKLLELDKSSI